MIFTGNYNEVICNAVDRKLHYYPITQPIHPPPKIDRFFPFIRLNNPDLRKRFLMIFFLLENILDYSVEVDTIFGISLIFKFYGVCLF